MPVLSLGWKIAGAASILALLIGGLFALYFHGKSAGRAQCQAEMQARVDEANQRATDIENAGREHMQSLEKSHDADVANFKGRLTAAMATIERVRASARSGEVPKGAGAAGQHPELPDRPGHAAADGGPDFEPALVNYGGDAEQLRLTLQACQRYAAAVKLHNKAIQ